RPDQYGCTTHSLPFDFVLTFGPEKRAGEVAIEELSPDELEHMAKRAVDDVAKHVPRPDLILVNHVNLMTLVGARLSKQWNVPFRIISHGTDTKLLQRAPRYRSLFRAAAMDAERVFAISAFVAGELRDLDMCRSVEVIGGAVDD